MEILKIYPNQKTPLIILDPIVGHLVFEGNCSPENIVDFMQPVDDWIDKCIEKPALISDNIVVEFKLSYYNTASYKYFFSFLRKISELINYKKNVVFLWYYEIDEPETKSEGEELFKELGLSEDNFELIPFEE